MLFSYFNGIDYQKEVIKVRSLNENLWNTLRGDDFICCDEEDCYCESFGCICNNCECECFKVSCLFNGCFL